MKNILMIALIIAAAGLSGCSDNEIKPDAYGSFEATEIIVSAEAGGKLLEFNVDEGQVLEQNTLVGFIDTVQLSLKKEQLIAQKKAAGTKFGTVSAQVNVLHQQKENALVEKERIERLLKDEAASQKQLDDINGNIDVINSQINQVRTQNSSTAREMETIDVQIAQIEDQVKKSVIYNPIKGTVLLKFAEPSEVVNYGKPLYKIADMTTMELRVYVSGAQLSNIKIGDKVKVLIDADKDSYKELEGVISWISSKAEFTPKIIQTKEERVNLVYAVKIKVANDGSIKIGMPGEVIFKK
jgi:HlyD family secretion protein